MAKYDGYMYIDNGFWIPSTTVPTDQYSSSHYARIATWMLSVLPHRNNAGGYHPDTPDRRKCCNHPSHYYKTHGQKASVPFDPEKYWKHAHEAMNKGPWEWLQRRGFWKRILNWHVPYPESMGSSAQTMEYGDDFCGYQLAKMVETNTIRKLLPVRCTTIMYLIHPSALCVEKGVDGKMAGTVWPAGMGRTFCEGQCWYYTWSVFHDTEARINQSIRKRWEVYYQNRLQFTLPSTIAGNTRSDPWNERNGNRRDVGQYAHGNSSIQSYYAHLYSHAGQPWKTQY